ncbi:uncharacterized protein PAC_01013 [Phialocephala subalpina]|uniref:Uncharacterized protein n=1 Tax=Phialocephala subalpina TaxID=576137 RepID=A0A1L7WEJ4_9HELO|nr:uncharacterized protein PAC_01013 [Phialocephala subalpina]
MAKICCRFASAKNVLYCTVATAKSTPRYPRIETRNTKVVFKIILEQVTYNMSDKAGPSKDTAKPRPSPLEDQASKADDENARKSQRHPVTEYGRMKQKFGPPTFSNPSTMVTLVIGEEKKEFLQNHGDNVSPDQLDEDLSLVELWALSDEPQMPRLQNLAIKAIHDIGHKLDSVATFTIDLAYKLPAEESALRRYIVATCCYELDPVDYKESPEDFPKEMLIDLAAYTADENLSFSEVVIKDYYVEVENDPSFRTR